MTFHPMTPDPGYFTTYISKVPSSDVISELVKQRDKMTSLMQALPPEKADYAYADGKWTVKEMIGHLIDSEKVFGYRAMRYSRNDKTPLHAFEEDDYVKNAFFSSRTLSSLLEEYAAVRNSTICFFKNLNEVELSRTGTANNKVLSVKQLLYIVSGHELHHLGVLKDRYGIG